MVDAIPLLALLHTVGAVVGVFFTTYAEAFYVQAAADGRIDLHEKKYLRRMYFGISTGILITLFSGISLIVLEYLIPNAPQAVLTAPFWSLQILTLLIVILGSLLWKKQIAWGIGSTAILVAWWFILLIDLGFMDGATFIVLFLTYLFSTIIVTGILRYLKIFFSPKTP